MKLPELSDSELVPFMALLKQLIRADGGLTDAEVDHLAALGEALGEDRWQTAFQAVKGQYKSFDDVPTLAGMVERPEARLCIHKTLTSVAEADDIGPNEARLLQALDTLWGLQRGVTAGSRKRRRLTR